MRQIISTAVVAVVVSLVTVTAVGALAQSEPVPTAQQAIAPAVTSINAHKVDGRHAVSASASRKKRRGKLVATNRQGFLPSNIIKPAWHMIGGKPPVLADDQVGWDELVGAAPKITLTTHAQPFEYFTTGVKTLDIPCPTGKVTGGGFKEISAPTGSALISSYPLNPTTWRLLIHVLIVAETGSGYVTCMTAEPATLVARLTPAAKKAKRDR